MKSSSTRSGPSCSGFWDTVRNKAPALTIVFHETFTCKNCGRVVIPEGAGTAHRIREITALMDGDGTME